MANLPPDQLAKQAQDEMMSLGGPVRWEGADTSPPPAKDKTAAVMPCSLQLDVCRFIAGAFGDGAKAIGWNSR